MCYIHILWLYWETIYYYYLYIEIYFLDLSTMTKDEENDYKKQINEYKTEQERYIESIAEMEMTMQELKNKITNKNDEIFLLQSSLDETKANNTELSDTIEELKTQLNNDSQSSNDEIQRYKKVLQTQANMLKAICNGKEIKKNDVKNAYNNNDNNAIVKPELSEELETNMISLSQLSKLIYYKYIT